MSTTLRHVVWELTLACDLACLHCGSRAGKAREDELDTAEALDVVRQLAELGAREVSLIGGEAYLRADFLTIVRAIADAGMLCSMVTGGRGVTLELARRMHEAGIGSVSVSLDGLGATHDVQRGVTGSFDAAVLAMRNLRAAGVATSANSQLNRLSFPELDGMLDLFLELGCHAWQVAMTVPMGRAAERPDWLFQPFDLHRVFPKLAELSARGRAGGLKLYAGNNVGYFGPHEDALRGHTTASGEGGYYEGCSAGHSGLGLEADGAVKGCPSLPTAGYVGGNVRETSIARIWHETAELAFARRDTPAALWGECARCYYASVCRGGCNWTAHVFFGRRGNNPYCHHRALEMRKRGLRERLVRESLGPGLPFDHGSWSIVVEPDDGDASWEPTASAPRRRLKLFAD
ncbi:MAG: radical SAM protein [Deltaproteobacteria bacterium]|nr:radical SAM protein [Deltaproteobacteria bacterium]